MVYLSCEDAIYLNHSKLWVPSKQGKPFSLCQVATISDLQLKFCTSRPMAYNDNINYLDQEKNKFKNIYI